MAVSHVILKEFFIERPKTYVARVRFGETSPTLDGEGPVEASGSLPTQPAATAASAARSASGLVSAP